MSRSPTLALIVLLAACTTGGGPSSSGVPAGPAAVVLEPGPVSAADERAAAELFERAQAALVDGAPQRAREALATIVERYPASRVSGEAAWTLAGVLSELGESLAAEAVASAYGDALGPADPRLVEVRLFQAERLEEAGDREAALDRLLRLPVVAGEIDEGLLGRVRRHADELSGEALARVLQASALGQPLAAPVMVAYARSLLLAGEREEAMRYAEAALAAGASGPEVEAARALAAGRLPAGEVSDVMLGAVLPLGGSPALQRYGAGVSEGIEAALAAEDASTYRVQLVVRDDQGDPAQAARFVQELEADGALGVVGPLQDAGVEQAAGARSRALPLVSPTAVQLPGGAPAVYSLGSTDPGGPRSLARYALRSGLVQVVILHSTTVESETEASLFEELFTELGGSLLRRMAYAPRTASFREQLEAVRNLRPHALVLPVPAEDIPQLAPQLTFYGLDTLGIRMLGTSGWTEESVLRDVSRRHTDGVVVATPYRPGEDPPGHAGFVAAYESHFRRSLRDPVPALGWDAASLLLLAVRSGARTPAEVARALADVRGFPGATGVLSMEDGRIVREHYLVCLQDRRPLPLGQATATRPPAVPGQISGQIPGQTPSVDLAPIPGAGPACPGSTAADRIGAAPSWRTVSPSISVPTHR